MKFANKSKSSIPVTQTNEPSPDTVQQSQTAPQTEAPPVETPDPSEGPSWLRVGAEAHKVLEQENAAAAAAKASYKNGDYDDKIWEFYLSHKDGGESAFITFLDGELDDKGLLHVPMYFQHKLQIGSKGYQPFVCLESSPNPPEPCPLCAGGNKPAYVAAMTVIDHRQIQGKNQIYHNQRKLFVATKQVITTLQKIAKKRGGLTGCLFEVTRNGDKEPRVGSMFDFENKRTLGEVQAEYGDKMVPCDYVNQLPMLPASELKAMGFGSQMAAVGSTSSIDTAALSKEM